MYVYVVEDKCASYPCQNGGSCFNTFSSLDEGFTCECLLGWTGDTCAEGNNTFDNDIVWPFM